MPTGRNQPQGGDPWGAPPPQPATDPWGRPIAPPPIPGDPWGAQARPTSSPWKAVGITVAALAVLALIGGILIGTGVIRLGAEPEPAIPPPPIEAPTTSTATRAPVTTRPPVATTAPAPAPRTGRQEPTRNPTGVAIQSTSSGTACSNTGQQSGWGGYPMASCRTWKDSTGLITGTPLGRGNVLITCQADVGEANPVYTANQHNTWWFWAQSGGVWDWFPETALSEGATNQPVNGIALCQ